VKLGDSGRLNYIINLSLIICKERQKKHANRMGEDTWLEKRWYMYAYSMVSYRKPEKILQRTF
jgi:hypothetical protein